MPRLPVHGTRPNVAFIPTTPQQDAGWRIGATLIGPDRHVDHTAADQGCRSGGRAAGGEPRTVRVVDRVARIGVATARITVVLICGLADDRAARVEYACYYRGVDFRDVPLESR